MSTFGRSSFVLKGLALAAACVVLVCAAAPAFAEKRVALVIGNDRYASLPALQKAVNDAETVGDTLARLGFEVVRGRDLGRQAMIERLAAFTSRLEAGDTAVVFYAGHGVAIGNVNYVVPVDAPAANVDAVVRGASISEPDIIAEIQARGARVTVLVLDACRDNPFPKQGTRSVGNARGLADAKSSARGVFVLYSAGAGQTALDRLERNDPNRNGVFTRIFVEHLARPGVHLGDLAVDVRERVAALALRSRNDSGEPMPHEQTPAYYDQTIGGRVFLAGREAVFQERLPVPPVASGDSEAQRQLAEAQARIAALEREMALRAVEARAAAAEQERRRAEEDRNRVAAAMPTPSPSDSGSVAAMGNFDVREVSSIMGVLISSNYLTVGNRSVDASRPSAWVAACARSCEQNASCRAFDLNLVYSQCVLYSSVKDRKSTGASISGVRK